MPRRHARSMRLWDRSSIWRDERLIEKHFLAMHRDVLGTGMLTQCMPPRRGYVLGLHPALFDLLAERDLLSGVQRLDRLVQRDRVRSQFERTIRISDGSYSILKGCIEMERDAANNTPEFKY